jgi:uncharacterized membrane protein YoaK (UPF0700 family)
MATPRAGSTLTHDDAHGPLPSLLLLLTFLTGLVDACSYLGLGNVFVANMTGNVVFLGFAAAGASGFSLAASLVALFFFLAGAAGGGRLGAMYGAHRGRLIARAAWMETLPLALALATAFAGTDGAKRYALIALLALAMGLQNAVARRLAVPDLTTTVLTLTLTGLGADSKLGDGRSPPVSRRLAAVLVMLLGAAVGALLLLHAGAQAALALATVLSLGVALAARRSVASTEAWTAAR